MVSMIPGEIRVQTGEIRLNVGRQTLRLTVVNHGDRPVQVGSHYHFFEVNPALVFERDAARGFRLDIPAGTAVRFEPGQARTVTLVALAGKRVVHGFRAAVSGCLDGQDACRRISDEAMAEGATMPDRTGDGGSRARLPAGESVSAGLPATPHEGGRAASGRLAR